MIKESSSNGNGDVMTAMELAKYLKVHRRTIYRQVKNGEIPGFKQGGEWRFKKSIIDDWMMDESLKNLRSNGGKN